MDAADRRKYRLFALAALLTLAADQLTKLWATVRLHPLGPAGLSIFRRNLVLVYTQNPGIAFSRLQTLSGGRVLLSLLSVVAVVFILWYLKKASPTAPMVSVGLGLVFGGALGNLADRIRLGKVTDFVLVDAGVWPLNPWPVFNVADAVLVVGVGLLILSSRAPKQSAAVG